MFLSLTTTRPPATDLGWLLHKHPDRVFEREAGVSMARVVFPEASDERCTAALIVEVDPVDLVRGEHGSAGLDAYVNERPYAAGSMLSVALNVAFRSAMAGDCDRPELVTEALPLEVKIAAAHARSGMSLLQRLFEPLGWTVEADLHTDDLAEVGLSRIADVRLTGTMTVQDALSQLYVLLPVLDGDKHYFVGEDEVDKLLRRGERWLPGHPDRELIIDRYLRRKRRLKAMLYERLLVEADDEEPQARDQEEERAVEAPTRLYDVRAEAVLDEVRRSGARSLVDLGCGSGRFLQQAVRVGALERIVGVDVDHRSLEVAASRLESLAPRQRSRVELLHGSLQYRDRRIEGLDAAVCVEVIEHMDLGRLDFLRRNLFEHLKPRLLVLTTPNVEHNVRFPTLPAGRLRHRDHRFEWTRAEFQSWCQQAIVGQPYTVRFAPIGEDDPEVGPPTQMAVFERVAA